MTLTVGSLFSGIGGIDLGLERAGMKVLWQVEINEWCRAVLAKHWPDVERFEDVRSVGGANLRSVDVLAGGFPCQDISLAGKGAGIKEGTRSGLWSEFARLIRELRPHYVLVENVSALLARGLNVVLADLAACGYDAEWDCIPASAVGAPHRRDRLWIVAYARHAQSEESQGDDLKHEQRSPFGRRELVASGAGTGSRARGGHLAARDAARGAADAGDARDGREPVADADSGRLTELTQRDRESLLGFCGSFGDDVERRGLRAAWEVEPNVGRVADGIPNRVDRLRGLGNAVVPQVVEWIGRRIVEAEALRSEQ